MIRGTLHKLLKSNKKEFYNRKEVEGEMSLRWKEYNFFQIISHTLNTG